MKDVKMTTLFSKMFFIVFFYGVVDIAIYSKSSAQPHSAFIEIQEILTIRTFTGKRLYSRDAEVFDRDVFTNFQCLDICLRTEKCASVDVKETNSKKLCRVNRPSQFHYLENKDNWSHINISGEDLRKILMSDVDECEEMETGESSSMTQTQAKLNHYCANEAPKEGTCKIKKQQGNCKGDWKARVLDNEWCCTDPNHPSQHCCCRIPQ